MLPSVGAVVASLDSCYFVCLSSKNFVFELRSEYAYTVFLLLLYIMCIKLVSNVNKRECLKQWNVTVHAVYELEDVV